MRKKLAGLMAILLLGICWTGAAAGPRRWLRQARIASPDIWVGMSDALLHKRIDELATQGVNAVDIDFSSEPLDVQETMVKRILAYARTAHPGMHFFVYQAPLESVSENVDMNRDGEVDPGKTSTYSEHPEWAQRGLDGEPALLYGADAQAFWVGPHDEDVWLCPNDPDYKKVWSEELRRLAATGVDGIYIDVPFLRGWFDEKRGWGWACACEDCAAIYEAQYGAKLPRKQNWDDPNFRHFVRFRFDQIADFVAEARRAVRRGNRKARLIIEHWDGITDATETACDPAMIAAASDARCHEWTSSGGTTSRYHKFSWIGDLVRYLYYIAADDGDPPWILAYTNKGDADRMQALAALQLTAGCNFWETDKPDMAGSVDEEARSELFSWIDSNQKTYYHKKNGLYTRVGLYYSRDSIVFYDYRRQMEPWLCSGEFLGIGMIMLQLHLPFRVVLPGDLDDIDVLVLPGVACLSDAEAKVIKSFAASGGLVVATGDTGEFDEDGERRSDNALADIFTAPGAAVRTRARIGYSYYKAASPMRKSPRSEAEAGRQREKFAKEIWAGVETKPLVSTNAGPFVILLPWKTKTGLQLRIFRVGGVDGGGAETISAGLRPPAGSTAVAVTWRPFLDDAYVPGGLKQEDSYLLVNIPVRLHGTLEFKLKQQPRGK